jgi:hypothetical protein
MRFLDPRPFASTEDVETTGVRQSRSRVDGVRPTLETTFEAFSEIWI